MSANWTLQQEETQINIIVFLLRITKGEFYQLPRRRCRRLYNDKDYSTLLLDQPSESVGENLVHFI
jgi:hypothetical protein